jgi:diguanylate cyclase (GGDEF)-like protein/PAS domain S-box-containing protein
LAYTNHAVVFGRMPSENCSLCLSGDQMKDELKTKQQLLDELVEIRERITELGVVENRSLRAEQALHEERAFTACIMDILRGSLLVVDGELRVILANRSFYRTFETAPEETEGRLVYDLCNGRWNIPNLRELLAEILSKTTSFEDLEVVQKFPKIGHRVMLVNARRIFKETDGSQLIVLIIEDITERKSAEQKIHNLAHYDKVTCLPNRQIFKEHMVRALAYAKRRRRLLATLSLDIDHFKHVNDLLGDRLADLLLLAVAERLKTVLRKSDFIARHEDEDLITNLSRFGGDEFVLLLMDVKEAQDAANVAQRIIHELSRPFVLEVHEVFISVSIGVSVYPFDGKDINTLIKNANAAMRYAKELGRNNYQFYSDFMNATTSRRLVIENDLKKALDRDELVLHYQPQIDISTGTIISIEALIRWRHSKLGLLFPAEFIALVEQNGLVEGISEWVLRTACAQNLAWQVAGFKPLRIAVNLSSLLFKKGKVVEIISKVLNETGMSSHYLTIEVTESRLLQTEDEIINALQQLKEMGIRIAIDDFGTGYSSLSYIRSYPLDALKIDRSFIKDITVESHSKAITIAIINMAKSLGLRVIAEGVETDQQLAFLKEQGCDEMQGHLFSPAVTPDAIAKLLRA